MREAASKRVSGTQRAEETKKKIRDFWDQEARDKQSKRRKGTVSAFKGKHHTEEAKQKNREAHLGHITTEETRRKLSIKSSGYHPKRQYGNGEWYIRSDGERIWLRSSYEVRVAKMLDLLHITWKYESKSFDLGDRFYCPDFLLDGLIWWEVKGWMKTEDKTKLIKFSKVYPNENIRIIYLKDIKNLESFNEVTNLDEIYRLGTKIEQI
mgnify:CR=1 FL=1